MDDIGRYTYSQMLFWINRQKSDCEGSRMLAEALAEIQQLRVSNALLRDNLRDAGKALREAKSMSIVAVPCATEEELEKINKAGEE